MAINAPPPTRGAKPREKADVWTVLDRFRKQNDARLSISLLEMARTYYAAQLRIEKELDGLVKQIEAAKAAGEEISPSWFFRQERYESMLTQVKNSVDDFAGNAEGHVANLIRDGAERGIKAAGELARATYTTLPPQLTDVDMWSRINNKAAEAMTAWVAKEDAPLHKLFSDMGVFPLAAAQNVFPSAIIQGKNPRWAASQLQKNIADLTLGRARVIARTEQHRAYRAAQSESFQENPAVTGWTWLAALDVRTCAVCWTMHGKKFLVNEPLPGHPNCRCAMVPDTKSWEELGFQGVDETAPAIPRGENLFAQLTFDEQRRILGPTRHDEYMAGKGLQAFLEIKHSDAWGDHIGFTQTVTARDRAAARAARQAAQRGTDRTSVQSSLETEPVVNQKGETTGDYEYLGGGITDSRVGYVNGQKVVIKGQEFQMVREGIDPGTEQNNEVAAYRVWQQLNQINPDFDLDMPVVVLRDDLFDGVRPAAVMQWKTGSSPVGPVGKKDARMMALFDSLIGNTDRHGGNYLISPDGRVIPIDHGLAFPVRQNNWGNHNFMRDRFDLTPDEANMLFETIHSWKSGNDNGLRGLLGDRAFEELIARGEYMLATSQTLTEYDISTTPWWTASVQPKYPITDPGMDGFDDEDGSMGGGDSNDRHWIEGESFVRWLDIEDVMGDELWDNLTQSQKDQLIAKGWGPPTVGEPWNLVSVENAGARIFVVAHKLPSEPTAGFGAPSFDPAIAGGGNMPVGDAGTVDVAQLLHDQAQQGRDFILWVNLSAEQVNWLVARGWNRPKLTGPAWMVQLPGGKWTLAMKTTGAISGPVPDSRDPDVPGGPQPLGLNEGDVMQNRFGAARIAEEEGRRLGEQVLLWGELTMAQETWLEQRGYTAPGTGYAWQLVRLPDSLGGKPVVVARATAMPNIPGVGGSESPVIPARDDPARGGVPMPTVGQGGTALRIESMQAWIRGGGRWWADLSAGERLRLQAQGYGPPEAGMPWKVILADGGKPILLRTGLPKITTPAPSPGLPSGQQELPDPDAVDRMPPVGDRGMALSQMMFDMANGWRWNQLTPAQQRSLIALGFMEPDLGSPWKVIRFNGVPLLVGVANALRVPSGNSIVVGQFGTQPPPPKPPTRQGELALGDNGDTLGPAIMARMPANVLPWARLSSSEQKVMHEMGFMKPAVGNRWKVLEWKGRPIIVRPVVVVPVQMAGPHFFIQVPIIVNTTPWEHLATNVRDALRAAGYSRPVIGEGWKKIRDPLKKNWVVVHD